MTTDNKKSQVSVIPKPLHVKDSRGLYNLDPKSVITVTKDLKAIGQYLQDYIDKLVKAKAVKDGMAYIHVLSPCPTGWRSPIDSMIELSKLAVETNYFPLWESDHGQFRFTHLPKKPRPVKAFTSLMGRFSHLSDQELQAIQDMADERFSQIQLQCRATGEKAGKSISQ